MAGGKSSGGKGKSSGGKTGASGEKKQVSHSAKAGLQVSMLLSRRIVDSKQLSFHLRVSQISRMTRKGKSRRMRL